MMKKFLLFLLLFVNLQIVMHEDEVVLNAGMEAAAQHMYKEPGDNCYDEEIGWYRSSLISCEGAVVERFICPKCETAFDDAASRDAHEKTCGETDDDLEFGDINDFNNDSTYDNSFNGGGGYGESYGGNGSRGNNNSNSSKNNTSKAKQASKKVISDVLSKYGAQSACNYGAQKMFTSLYNGKLDSALKGMANDIARQMRTSKNWTNIGTGDGGAKNAQKLAANGWFVVGAWYNSGGNGHVVVIMPDGNCLDCGPSRNSNCPGKRDDRSWRYSFGDTKRTYVEFYKYREKY